VLTDAGCTYIYLLNVKNKLDIAIFIVK